MKVHDLTWPQQGKIFIGRPKSNKTIISDFYKYNKKSEYVFVKIFPNVKEMRKYISKHQSSNSSDWRVRHAYGCFRNNQKGKCYGELLFYYEHMSPITIAHEAVHAAHAVCQFHYLDSESVLTKDDYEEALATVTGIISSQLSEIIFKLDKYLHDELELD